MFKLFRSIVQYGLESGDKSVVHETLISIPILFPPDFDTKYGSKVKSKNRVGVHGTMYTV